MRILMVSSYLPYPLYSGGHIRLYNILKRLSNKHEITLVCEIRPNQTKEDIMEVEKICRKVITVPRKKQWSFTNILKTGLSNKPFLITGHLLPQMKDEIEELLDKERFDLIHVETFYVAQNLPKTKLPIVVVEHNIEYLVYKRYAQETNLPLKPLIRTDVLKLKVQEEKVWKKADAVIAVSNQDKEIIQKFNKNVYVIPNGVDVGKFKIQNSKFKIDKKDKTLLFIGDFKWVQNRDAVSLILKKIWPKIKSKIKNQKSQPKAGQPLAEKIKLWVVGRKIPDSIRKLGSDDVVFDENTPEDTSLIFKNSDILLAPIRVGGGTSYKILEAMASGVPVVTTTLGAQGLLANDRKEVIVADTEYRMIEGITELIENQNLFEKIAQNARILIEKNYNWDIITQELEKVYKKTLVNN